MSKAVKKVALVAAGAALGFVTGGVGFAIIGGAVGLFVGSQQDAALKGGRAGTGEPSAQTVRSSKAPARFILGRVSTGGVLVWAQEQTGNQDNGEWVHLVYVLSEGEVDGLEKIYLGEEEVGTYGEYASYELIVNPTQVNAFLKANCRDWKDSQIGRGLSFVRLSLKHNAEKFPSGIPNVRFVVRGRKDLYDPRTGMTGYSENTALHLLWFLRTRCKVPDDEIVFESFASAANVCDEAVGNADGTTGVRYRTGCVIGADEQRTSVLQKLEESCAGQLIRVGGKWMLQAGAYYGPYDFEITEDMVIGTVSGSTEVGNDAAINIVTGTFIDPSQSWAETDFPEVRVQQWVDQDGGEASESMSLGYVTDAYQAQRLANIKLRRARAGGSLQIPMNFAGYNCRPGRVVRVNLPSLNIVGECIVTDWNMASDDGCTVTVSQYEAAIFDDAVGKPYNPLGFINMPAGGLGSPTGLAWTQDETAEIAQGVLSWVPPFGVVTGYAVTVRRDGVAVQARQVPETTMQLPFSGLPSGNYTMSVAALGPLARSGEASITVNIDGPPVPEACVVQSSIDSITLFPSNTLHGLNGGTYEYFFSLDPQATAAQAEYLGQGMSLTHTGLAFFTNYYYFVRSKNAYGVSGFLKVPASTSTDVSTFLDALEGKINETQLGQELLTEIEKISGEGPESVNGRIEAAKQELEGLITELTDPLEYVPTNAYLKNDAVRKGQRLYMAIADVPAAADGANAPPNPTYWVDIGSIAETANGLAQAVSKNTADISTIDGKVTANAAMLQAVQSAYRDDDGEGALNDALRGWDTLAKVSEESRTRATQNEAMASRMTTVEASVGENKGSIRSLEQTVVTNEQATASRFLDVNTKVGANSASISALEKTVTDNESSTASRLQTVNSRVDATNAALDQEKAAREDGIAGERALREASISEEATTRADADQALGVRIGYMEATFTFPQSERDDDGEGALAGALKGWENTAKIAEEAKVRATEIDAQAKKTETLEVSFNSGLDKANGEIQKTNAAVQVTSQALAALDGKASTMWSVKMQINAQGQYVAAGIGLGIENGPAGLQSQFLVSADRFAVVNGINGTLSAPFVVQSGQVYINQAFINQAFIQNIVLGMTLRSQAVDSQGRPLIELNMVTGAVSIRGQSVDGSILLNNNGLYVYDANGVERTAVGRLT
ncbi:phage tail tip fiber protein [Pseudomonas sp. NY15372]|uniref:phage tail protein n=1 Tax=Pseudomonas sp. NY15372 TaxID=3400356 RepID=UPI003A8B294E